MSDSAIEAVGLSRAFGQLMAVDGLNLSVPKGQIYGFLGPNGCGKSTAIRMLTGLLTPSAGTARVLGLAIPQQAEALRRRIGYMTQKFALYGDLTVRENLMFMAQIFSLSTTQASNRIAALSQTYQLQPLAGQLAGTLSGGQKQRLALACACLNQPEVLFLDEPTSAVDPQSRRDFWEQLFDLSAAGTTILVTTHYMDEAERCHGLAIMNKGAICASGSPQQLMSQLVMHIIELTGSDLRQLKQHLTPLPQIRSVAQLGNRLRLMIEGEITAPELWLKAYLPDGNIRLQSVRPNLEDVFVACTGQHARQSQPPSGKSNRERR
ncbi:ABC transporter ATP-binding protein [Shewanella sp. NFH-SH190041]|uniref:ABC transporter ATP-binding protein n=1 Tax=Shewanella sp. NFH-SH190041 TaxID=2950245 RepID=UPI0021C2B8A3|nr:ABC transporter ATP-binding protein [Shewanella sp. NFH-SH190041]BDM65835.1 ABC transporter ATP-binding protein [Shewanella sp. NFH-SH190041]